MASVHRHPVRPGWYFPFHRAGHCPGRRRHAARERHRRKRCRDSRCDDHGDRYTNQYQPHDDVESIRRVHVQQHTARCLPRRRRARRVQEIPARQRRGERQHDDPRRDLAGGRHARRIGHRHRRSADAADRPHRHRAHHRKHADHADAAGVQPELPGAAHHRAGRLASVPAALGVLQLAGKPLEQRQRSVAAGQQRTAGRCGQQRQRRESCFLHPLRGGD